jgi:hypothetical protein
MMGIVRHILLFSFIKLILITFKEILLMMAHLSQVGPGLNNIIRRGIPCEMKKTGMISLQESTNNLCLTE